MKKFAIPHTLLKQTSHLIKIQIKNEKVWIKLKNDVSKGDKLSSVEVCFKRVNLEGISRRDFIEYKDSRFNKDLEAGSPIKKEYLDG